MEKDVVGGADVLQSFRKMEVKLRFLSWNFITLFGILDSLIDSKLGKFYGSLILNDSKVRNSMTFNDFLLYTVPEQ